TDLGTVRTNNEDSALASPRLLVLADGMGGHAAGEVASTIALRMFAEVDQSEESSFEQEFPRAGGATRRILHTMSESDPILESMGTTLVAIGCDGEHLRSEEHTSELQSRFDLVCRLLLEKKKKNEVRGRGDKQTT